MMPHSHTVSELLATRPAHQALCAFNAENFDTLTPIMRAAGELVCPVIVAFSVPAARYLGYDYLVDLVALTAHRFGTEYALHLDHCEDAVELRAAVEAGFTSVNFLNEGTLSDPEYLSAAQALAEEYRDRISLEFVLGTLGHATESAHDGHTHHRGELRSPNAAEVIEFAAACQPDILGFHCGSLHGMRTRERTIDLSLIREISSATGLPIVLHGSSGVRTDDILAGIDVGVRKVNIETSIRTVYMSALRTAACGGGSSSSSTSTSTSAGTSSKPNRAIVAIRTISSVIVNPSLPCVCSGKYCLYSGHW